VPELFFAFLTLFCWGLKDVLNKRLLAKIDVYSLSLTEYFFAILLMAASLLLFSKPVFPQGDALLLVLFASILGAASILAYFKAVQTSKIGLVFAVSSSFPLFSVLFSALFLGEPFQNVYLVSLPLILAALFLLAYRNQGFSIGRGVWLALLASISWGAFFTMAKPVALQINAFNASFFMEGGVLIVLAACFLAFGKKLVFPPSAELRWFTFFYVVLFAAGVIFGNLSFLAIGVSLTSLITATAPALNALMARIFLKEKLTKTQYAGIVLLIASLALLSF